MPKNNDKLVLIALSCIFAIQLFVLAPASLYFNNLDEMGIALPELLRLCLVPALITVLAFVFIGYPLPERFRNHLNSLLAALVLIVWLQSNVLVWDYGLLDGRMIDWSDFSWQGWLDGAAWLVVLTTGIILGKRRPQLLFNIATAIFTIQLLATTVLAAQTRDNWVAEGRDNSNALQELYRFSPDKNIVHIMVDGFQSDIFHDLIERPGIGDHYRQAFEGFTYYPETLSVFPYTRFSVPSFLSGKIYDNQTPQDFFVDKALAGKTIISTAKEHGYAIDIVAGNPYLEKRYAKIPHDNLYPLSEIASGYHEAAKMIDIALFRSLPHFAKPLVYRRQQWLLSHQLAANESMHYNYFKHTFFLHQLIQGMTVNRQQPVYKYIHIMNTHNPMVVNSQCKYTGEILDTNRQTLTAQSKCTIDTLTALMQKMKDLGIYKNSLIIIHADHGGWVRNNRNRNSDKKGLSNEFVISLASPLLMIKKTEAYYSFTSTDTLASLADLPDTISDIESWQTAFGHLSLYSENAKNPQRKRIFRFYTWRKTEWNQKYAAPIVEFSIKGSHYDNDWKVINTYHPPKN